jgi:hypothetical protein
MANLVNKEDNMDKKGLNFIVGLVALFVIFRMWSSGFLHDVGFLAVNNFSSQEISYKNTSGDFVYSTPLAVFMAIVIDLVAILGSLVVILLTGIWEILGLVTTYVRDMLLLLRDYINNYLEERKKPKEEDKDIKEDSLEDNKEEVVVEIQEQENLNPIVVILEAIREEQNKLSQLVEDQQKDILKLKGDIYDE